MGQTGATSGAAHQASELSRRIRQDLFTDVYECYRPERNTAAVEQDAHPQPLVVYIGI